MKLTICVTQRCNLRCSYCYVGKREATMSYDIASRVVDWIYAHAIPEEPIDVGIFGGEPLIELPTVKMVTELVEGHAAFDPPRVTLTVVSNGTVFSDEIATFLTAHGINYCMSCDGPPEVQDRFRRFEDGSPSSDVVARNARAALAAFGSVPVNAVYRPETFRDLPEVVDYLSSLGFRHIYLNPDFSAPWSARDADELPALYAAVASRYVEHYLAGDPHFVSFIDGKLAVLLRGGYLPMERCRMGKGELAFTPDGGIYPCERLIGCGTDGTHRLGDVFSGLRVSSCPARADAGPTRECVECGLREFCMSWCGCSNYFSTGHYDRVGAFLCASERAAISTAASVFQDLETEFGPTFLAHFAGSPSLARTGRY